MKPTNHRFHATREGLLRVSPLETVPSGTPCWIDLSSSDMDRASSFYGALFGWSSARTDNRFGFYPYLLSGRDSVAGMMEQPEAPANDHDSWCPYFKVDDVPAAIARAVAAGGQEIEAGIPAGEVGMLGLVADPEGAVVGLRTPRTPERRLLSEHVGAPCWIELVTGNLGRASTFYSTLFETPVNARDTGADGHAYATINANGENVAGIQGNPGSVPGDTHPYWIIQFRVDDCNGSVRNLLDLGGSLIEAPRETPYSGTVATVADPTGARFAIVAR